MRNPILAVHRESNRSKGDGPGHRETPAPLRGCEPVVATSALLQRALAARIGSQRLRRVRPDAQDHVPACPCALFGAGLDFSKPETAHAQVLAARLSLPRGWCQPER